MPLVSLRAWLAGPAVRVGGIALVVGLVIGYAVPHDLFGDVELANSAGTALGLKTRIPIAANLPAAAFTVPTPTPFTGNLRVKVQGDGMVFGGRVNCGSNFQPHLGSPPTRSQFTDCDVAVEPNQSLELTAYPNPGWYFKEWQLVSIQGVIPSTGQPCGGQWDGCVITPSATVIGGVTGVFEQGSVITVQNTGVDPGVADTGLTMFSSIERRTQQCLAYVAQCVFAGPAGSQATILQLDTGRPRMLQVTGNAGCGSINASNASGGTISVPGCRISLTGAPVALTATYDSSVSLSLQKFGSGTATITSSPGGISCGSTCNTTVALNTSVTFSAQTFFNSKIASWAVVNPTTDAERAVATTCGTQPTCTVTVTRALQVRVTVNQ